VTKNRAMKAKNYLNFNKEVYENLASEFRKKKKLRIQKDKAIIDKFSLFLGRKPKLKILDLGPGSGQMSRLMTQKRLGVDAIDISLKMAKVAQETAPKARVVVGDFISYDFKNKKYDGILAVAFIHLFPGSKTRSILRKMYGLLKKDGVMFLSTTKHSKSEESYFRKVNFEKKLKRFRKRFTKKELEGDLVGSGYRVIHYYENHDKNEGKSKIWMNFIVQKS
jgi:2-polyprenyl-3-methyl-5-hydroxy-6-metoxy-1,4-benzoquinol methylase